MKYLEQWGFFIETVVVVFSVFTRLISRIALNNGVTGKEQVGSCMENIVLIPAGLVASWFSTPFTELRIIIFDSIDDCGSLFEVPKESVSLNCGLCKPDIMKKGENYY